VDPAQVLSQRRAEQARTKAAAADKAQPTNANRIGQNSDKAGGSSDGAGVDIMRLAQDKFAKLSEETLSKMRGDEL
jgi:hypothetical protein